MNEIKLHNSNNNLFLLSNVSLNTQTLNVCLCDCVCACVHACEGENLG